MEIQANIFGIRTSLENFGKLSDTHIVPFYAIGDYVRRKIWKAHTYYRN